MKSYTDIEQSKKLAEILPLESADMCRSNDGTAIKIDANPYSVRKIMWKDYEVTPCWSLAALLNVISYPTLSKEYDDTWSCATFPEDEEVEGCETPIDACYELILELHEQKLL